MGQEKERHPSVKESADDVSPPLPGQASAALGIGGENILVEEIREEKAISPAQTRAKLAVGIVLVILVTISWTGSTQFTKSAYQNATVFNSPFFIVYFSTSWMSICFPLYLLCQLLAYAAGISSKAEILAKVKATSLVFGAKGARLKSVASRTAFFILFWFIANYSYSRALSYIAAADVTAIFSSNLAFVYLLSLCILRDRVYLLKVISIILSIAGIVMMAYEEGFNGVGLIGVCLVVAASLAAAVYKVVFKRVIGDASFGQVSLFMTAIGLVNLLFIWPIMLGVVLSGEELVIWEEIPWWNIIPSAVLSLTFNFLINLGIAVTHPLFVSVGIFLGYPLNAVVDVVARHHHMGTWEIAGSVLIVLGFGLMLLPDNLIANLRGSSGLDGRSSSSVSSITSKEDHRHNSTDSSKPIQL